MTTRLLVTRPLPDPVIAALRALGETEIRPLNHPMTRPEAVEALGNHDAILPTLGDPFDAETFTRAGVCRCRLLANFGVGYNHIDTGAAAACGITVSNTPGAVTDATADIAMTLILMAARRAGEGERLVRAGRWEGWHPTQMLGLHVTGRTLGVIGMGRIGRAVARRAHFGFSMPVVFFNRSPVDDCGIPGARQLSSPQAVMRAADIVSLNVPGGAATRHLISADVLAAARPGAVLVNTSRGEVIDEAALVAALRSGPLGAAGLDVYEHEPKVPRALRELENAVLLPHLGTAALDVRTEMGLMAVANIRAFLAGKTPPNRVGGPA